MDKIYIIGNGFDLDLGLKTSYQDFLYSNYFTEMLQPNSSNQLARYLSEIKQKETWVDIEVELKNYVAKSIYDKSNLRQEYQEILQRLEKYLENINTEKNIDSGAYRMMQEVASLINLHQYEIIVVNFNYTHSVENILLANEVSEEDIKKTLVYPHGKLGSEGIVFGLEDQSGIDTSYNFIKKSGRPGYTGISLWGNHFAKANEIYIYGHSLGTSDKMYFEPLFQFLVTTPGPKTFYIYCKEGDTEKYQDRIMELTADRLGTLISQHKYKLNAVTKGKAVF